jgi:hypothetical protein
VEGKRQFQTERGRVRAWVPIPGGGSKRGSYTSKVKGAERKGQKAPKANLHFFVLFAN